MKDIDESIIHDVTNATDFKQLNHKRLYMKNRIKNPGIPYNYFLYCLAVIYDDSHLNHSNNGEYENSFRTFVNRIEAFKKDIGELKKRFLQAMILPTCHSVKK